MTQNSHLSISPVYVVLLIELADGSRVVCSHWQGRPHNHDIGSVDRLRVGGRSIIAAYCYASGQEADAAVAALKAGASDDEMYRIADPGSKPRDVYFVTRMRDTAHRGPHFGQRAVLVRLNEYGRNILTCAPWVHRCPADRVYSLACCLTWQNAIETYTVRSNYCSVGRAIAADYTAETLAAGLRARRDAAARRAAKRKEK